VDGNIVSESRPGFGRVRPIRTWAAVRKRTVRADTPVSNSYAICNEIYRDDAGPSDDGDNLRTNGTKVAAVFARRLIRGNYYGNPVCKLWPRARVINLPTTYGGFTVYIYIYTLAI